MRNAGLEEHKLETRLPGETSITSDNTTLMVESEEELKSLLMKVKEDSEIFGLKLNILKMKIMASSPITSWQTDGETVETVADTIFWGSKITVDGDCSHEIRRRLLLGRKVMTNLDIKKQRHYFANKSPCSQGYGFSSGHVWCESWIVKKAEHRRTESFELWCWRRLLRVPGQQGDPTSPS